MTTRRRFVSMLTIAPLAGVGLLAACGEKAPPAASTPAPAPTPTPAPAPATPPPAAVTAPPAAAPAPAAPTAATLPAVVDVGEQLANTLGYVTDATKVDVAKFPGFVAGRNCTQCTLYTGAAGEASGPCGIFNGRLVSAQGWCSAWAKKA